MVSHTGRTYITEQDTSTADMPVGYADGIHRSASGFNPLGSQRTSHRGGPVAVRMADGTTKSCILLVASAWIKLF